MRHGRFFLVRSFVHLHLCGLNVIDVRAGAVLDFVFKLHRELLLVEAERDKVVGLFRLRLKWSYRPRTGRLISFLNLLHRERTCPSCNTSRDRKILSFLHLLCFYMFDSFSTEWSPKMDVFKRDGFSGYRYSSVSNVREFDNSCGMRMISPSALFKRTVSKTTCKNHFLSWLREYRIMRQHEVTHDRFAFAEEFADDHSQSSLSFLHSLFLSQLKQPLP